MEHDRFHNSLSVQIHMETSLWKICVQTRKAVIGSMTNWKMLCGFQFDLYMQEQKGVTILVNTVMYFSVDWSCQGC